MRIVATPVTTAHDGATALFGISLVRGPAFCFQTARATAETVKRLGPRRTVRSPGVDTGCSTRPRQRARSGRHTVHSARRSIWIDKSWGSTKPSYVPLPRILFEPVLAGMTVSSSSENECDPRLQR